MLSKRLYRSERDRVVAGVAGGIAEYLGWSPLLVRLLWILALIPGGIPGLLPYLVCWLIIPTESRTRTWS
jgi:phage shock protein C